MFRKTKKKSSGITLSKRMNLQRSDDKEDDPDDDDYDQPKLTNNLIKQTPKKRFKGLQATETGQIIFLEPTS